MRRWGTHAGVALLLLAAAAWLLASEPAPQASLDYPAWLPDLDLRNRLLPAFAYTRSALLDGELPLWNPYQLLGSPFLATHRPQVFYPLMAPFLPLAPHVGLVGHALLHLVLAGFFVWLFARRLGLEAPAALAAALAFASSRPITDSIFNPAFLSNRVWLPAIFCAVYAISQSPTRRSAALLALALALPFLGGDMQGSLYAYQAAGLYALVLMAAAREAKHRTAMLAALVAGGVVAVALMGAQLVPTLELASTAVRNLGGLTPELAGLTWLGEQATMQVIGELGTAMSVMLIPLLPAALVARRRRGHALFFLVLVVLAADFLRGNAGYLFPAYYALPLGGLFRAPQRIAFVLAFAGAMLVGLGASAVLRRCAGRAGLARVLAIAIPLLVVVDLHVRAPLVVRYPLLAGADGLYGPDEIVEFARTRAEHSRLYVFYHPQDQRVPSRMGLLQRFFMASDYEPLLPAICARAFGVPEGERWFGALVPAEPGAGPEGRPVPVDRRLLDALAVRYYVNGRDPAGAFPVTEREGALPRAYIVHGAIVAASDDEALRLVRELAFEPEREAVLLAPARAPEPALAGAREVVRITSYGRNSVALTAECASECLVVLSDLHFPGWQATVDGAPAEILRANYLVRAVRLAAGKHDIEYRYRPRSVTIGVALSLVGILGLAALLRTRRGDRPA